MKKPKFKFDFGGWATKNNLKCSDGRVIMKDAFKHHDGQQLPLVWAHLHNSPGNVLGHAILENRADGVYAYCKFNNSQAGKDAAEAVKHGDITQLSIYANALKQKGSSVIHGMIREVSLVLSGANPGAQIDNLAFAHGDETVVDDTEAIIYTGLKLVHSDSDEDIFDDEGNEEDDDSLNHGDDEGNEEDDDDDSLQHEDNRTIAEVVAEFSTPQKQALYAIVAQVTANERQNNTGGGTARHSGTGGKKMKKNVFDRQSEEMDTNTLTHGLTLEKFNTLVHDSLETAKKGSSFREAVIAHAKEYGITNIEVLFPEARSVRGAEPELAPKRDKAWVRGLIDGCNKAPFSNIKSTSADITEDEARARGYITGNKKIEQIISVMRRTTHPQTVYIKQKLDRDNIIDVTDFDVVAWLWRIMRMLLNEEIARAILIGDGRLASADEKIRQENIRSVWLDDEFYAPKIAYPADSRVADMIDNVVRANDMYNGTGEPILYTTKANLTEMLLTKDTNGRRIYLNKNELASAMLVSDIVAVEPMKNQSRTNEAGDEVDLWGILLDPGDYTLGANKGGELTQFDDFDIDFNQYKYLLETRMSGTLTNWRTAVIIEKERANG